MYRFSAVVCLFLFCCASPLAGAPVRVVKTVRDNPTLYLGNLTGNSAFTTALRSFLTTCGWFDVTNSPRADYVLKGQSAAGKLILSLELGGAPAENAIIYQIDFR